MGWIVTKDAQNRSFRWFELYVERLFWELQKRVKMRTSGHGLIIDEDSIEMSELGRKLVRWGCVDKKQKKGSFVICGTQLMLVL